MSSYDALAASYDALMADVAYVKRGMELGFPSVMYDGSTLPLAENYDNTCAVVELAHRLGISVEAEVGSMGVREGGEGGGEIGHSAEKQQCSASAL